MKPCLTDKTLKGERITLTENEKVVSDESELVKSLMSTFQILYQTYIQRPPSIILHHDSMLNAIKKFENHSSILEIKKNKFRLT